MTRNQQTTDGDTHPVVGSREAAGIAWADAGRGSAWLLIHGGLVDQRVWHEVIGPLSRLARVVTYDRAGAGRSADVVGQDDLDDAHALIVNLGLMPCVVVGLSYGARLALDIALTWPDAVSHLILVSPDLDGVEPSAYVADQAERFMAAIGEGRDDDAADVALATWFDGPMRLADELDPAVREQGRVMVAEAIRRRSAPRPRAGIGARHRLPQVRAQTLIVLGDRDVADVRVVTDVLASGLPRPRVEIIAGVGHHLPLEVGERLAALALDFVLAREETTTT